MYIFTDISQTICKISKIYHSLQQISDKKAQVEVNKNTISNAYYMFYNINEYTDNKVGKKLQ